MTPLVALGKAARVHEDQRRPMLAHQLGEPVVHLLPNVTGHHRFERSRRQLDRKIPPAHVAGVDDRAASAVADQEFCDFTDRLLRG